MTRPNVAETLEQLIDDTSLLDVITGLELVCEEKAEHLLVNWQDKEASRVWRNAARIIRKVVYMVEPLDV